MCLRCLMHGVLSNKFAKLLKCLVWFDADYLVLGLYAFLFRIWQLTCDTLKSCFLWQIHVYNIQWIAHTYNACIDFRTLFIPIDVIRCIKLFHLQFFLRNYEEELAIKHHFCSSCSFASNFIFNYNPIGTIVWKCDNHHSIHKWVILKKYRKIKLSH